MLLTYLARDYRCYALALRHSILQIQNGRPPSPFEQQAEHCTYQKINLRSVSIPLPCVTQHREPTESIDYMMWHFSILFTISVRCSPFSESPIFFASSTNVHLELEYSKTALV